jgi:hypothetical protein
MKPKLILCVALVLSGGLFGCSTTAQRNAISRTPEPPSAEQVSKWGGFPEGTHLNLATNFSSQDFVSFEKMGKLKWAGVYEYRKGRSSESYTIALFEPGTLWRTNRANFIKHIEDRAKANKDKSIDDVITLPDGQKIYYASAFGFFSFHPDFDLLIILSLDSRDDYPPEERIEIPANASDKFYELFKNVDELLDSESPKSKP